MDALTNLQKRNNILKSKLLHEQLKHGNYQFRHFKKESLLVLNAYKTYKSISKAASSVGVNKNLALNWFVRGGLGDSQFRGFYLAINDINGFKPRNDAMGIPKNKKRYSITQLGDAWCYITNIDGERISIISGDLDNLKLKVKSNNLPLS